MQSSFGYKKAKKAQKRGLTEPFYGFYQTASGEHVVSSIEHPIDFRKTQELKFDHQYSMNILRAFLSSYIKLPMRSYFHAI